MHDPAWSHCLVVGGEGGLGSAIARRLSEVQAGRVSVSRRDYTLDRSEFVGSAFNADLESAIDCSRLIATVVERSGPIDALVVAIGAVHEYTHFSEISEEGWAKDLWVNLSAPFFLARAATLSMKESGNGGRIVLFSTESARHGSGSHSLAYGAAKAGIEVAVRVLAKDGARDGILVNAISPGFIQSGFHERWQHKTESDIAQRVEKIPMRRAGTVTEVAGVVEFLLSRDSGFITGTSISVTGGDWL